MSLFDEAIAKLQNPGSVGVIPTDTVYGLVARAADPAAVKRLFTVKPREGKPGTVIATSIDQLEALGLKRRYLTAVQQFWPGAVSVIIPCADPALAYLHGGMQSLAVRIPNNTELLNMLSIVGPLMTSSANAPGEPTSTTVEQAKHYFTDKVDFYVDGGDLSHNQASTIIRMVDDAIEIIRQGAVIINQ